MTVTPDKIAVALGKAAPVKDSILEKQWEMWVGDAVMLIEDKRLELAHVDPIDEVKIDYVVREAVVAHIKKPDDATQVTVSTDDSSSSRTYQSGKGRVVIIDEWWRFLGLVETDSGAFSIDMLPNGSAGHTPWCSFHFGARYCSCGASIAGKPLYGGEDDL